MRSEAARVTDLRGANVARQFNLPPSYILIHRVSTAGIGVLCQLEAAGEFRAEVLRWMPGYGPDELADQVPLDDQGPRPPAGPEGPRPPAGPEGRGHQPAGGPRPPAGPEGPGALGLAKEPAG